MSFETSWGVAPPALPTPDKTAKRKRPSTDPAKIDGATINLEKLMGLMDKEASQPKTPSGKDLKKAASGKKDKPVETAPGAGAGGGGGPAAKKQRQDTRPPPKSAQATTTQEPKAPRTDGKAEKGKGRGKNKAAKKANAAAAAAAAAAGGETPALPPHFDMDVDTPVAPVPASATIALKPLADDAPAADIPSPSVPVESKKSKKAQKKERLAAAAASASKPTASATSPVAASKKSDASSSKNTVVMLDDEPSTGAAPAAPADSNLTPMQLKMKRKLEGSRFRFINEQLYTTSSEEALDMMKKDPSVFADYHLGFRSQTSMWPTSPVSLLTSTLSASLPSSSLIIDLGCGDAELARTLVPEGYKVLSYDLVGDEWVTECDYCQGIPLPGKEGVEPDSKADSRIVDAAVCCLSLMGRNWMDGVREIARVVKDGGRFDIAEVQSRMSSTDAFVDMVKSLGFTLAKKDDSNTHFVVLSFVREGEPTWADEGQTWQDVLKQGEEVLKACVYKKR